MTTTQSNFIKRNRMLVVFGVAVVVLLAIIAFVLVSQTVRAGQEADAKASAVASASAMESAINDVQASINAERVTTGLEANKVCEKRLLQQLPTSTPVTGKTKSTFKASDGSYDTQGAYTDVAAGNPMPMQFLCSSIKQSDGSWSVFLKSTGH